MEWISQGIELTLTFEDREVAVLRTYDSWKIASRDKVTRAEFILSLITEVKEFKIPVMIPRASHGSAFATIRQRYKGIDATMYKRKGTPATITPAATPHWYANTGVGKELETPLVAP